MDYLKLIVEKFSENNYNITHETFDYFFCDFTNNCLKSFDNFNLESANKLADFNNKRVGSNNVHLAETYLNIMSKSHTNHFSFFSLIKCFEYTDTKHKEALLKIDELENESLKTKKQLAEVETIVIYLSKELEKLKQKESIKVEIPNLIDF